jgi:serine/threonine protein kinase, bacterial
MNNSSGETPNLLNQRYQILNVLSHGGFGRTYLVQDTQMPSARRCVLKQLKPVNDSLQIRQMVQERFQREAAILEQLGEHHDQIPRLYAYFSEGEEFYLVEEWIEGETLTERVHQQGTLGEATVRSILSSVLPVIADIHAKQIVHRDIKPDNIILRKSDSKPVLIDFGAVKETMSTVINSQGNSTHSIVVGTPGYMPSEQLAGRPMFSSDLYSLGLTAIYLLTGRHPQQLDNDPLTGNILWRKYVPNISDEFAAVLDKAIQLNASYRFATAAEMLSALNGNNAAQVTIPPLPYPEIPSTIMPVPQSPAGADTQGIFTQNISGQSVPTQVTGTPSQPVQAASGGEWKKALITGGIIGVSILAGALMLRGQVPGFSNGARTVASASPSPSPSVSPSLAPSPSPTSTPSAAPVQEPASAPVPAIPALTPVSNSNATIVGEPGTKNIRSSPATNQTVLYHGVPGDRIRVTGTSRNSDGHLWYRISLPNGDEGWLASQLVKLDQAIAPDKPNTQTPPQPEPSGVNATIIGEAGTKNIRTGPGTNYGVQHTAVTGDRVRIIDTRQDSGGYVWHKIYFPKSGAEGWIAAQLIQRD